MSICNIQFDMTICIINPSDDDEMATFSLYNVGDEQVVGNVGDGEMRGRLSAARAS